MKKCTNPACSAIANSDSNKFCMACGSLLIDVSDGYNPGYPIQPPKKNRVPVAFIVASVSIIILLIGTIVFLLLSQSKNSSLALSDNDENISSSSSKNKSQKQRDNADFETAGNNNDLDEKPSNVPSEPIKSILLKVVQVDVTNFPNVNFYASILDENNNVVKNLRKEQFEIYELDSEGNTIPANIEQMRQILVSENVNINLVLDKSGSMSEQNKMPQAQYAASTFLTQVCNSSNDLVEITLFDDFVYVANPFSNDYSTLSSSINNIRPDGQTALYDAIYSSLLSTNNQIGAKCVVVFTDGIENRSSCTYNDVVDLANATGIPLYVIGIGKECDISGLTELANETNGKFFYAETTNLGDALAQIYLDVYNLQRECYFIEYKSNNSENLNSYRQMVFSAKDDSGYSGEHIREYVPVPILNHSFSEQYKNKNFILDFSSQRAVTANDLRGLSLAELRIARNEVFARHGRMFKDAFLNKWFYSKPWYLNIMPKYSPDNFDKLQSPLSKIELENVTTILDFENYIMDNERIFPSSSTYQLTEYDVSLSKAVLRRGLEEIYYYANVPSGDKSRLSSIELYNVQMIEKSLSEADIKY